MPSPSELMIDTTNPLLRVRNAHHSEVPHCTRTNLFENSLLTGCRYTLTPREVSTAIIAVRCT